MAFFGFFSGNTAQRTNPSPAFIKAHQDFEAQTKQMTASATRIQLGALILAAMRQLSRKPLGMVLKIVIGTSATATVAAHVGITRQFKDSQSRYLAVLGKEQHFTAAHVNAIATVRPFIPSQLLKQHLPPVTEEIQPQLETLLALPHLPFDFPAGGAAIKAVDGHYQREGFTSTLQGLCFGGLDQGAKPLAELGAIAGHTLTDVTHQLGTRPSK